MEEKEEGKWPEDKKCSFNTFSSVSCGYSDSFPNQHDTIKISECTRDITSHLKSLNLSLRTVPSEGHLLCFRIGIFSLMKHYSICPSHRAAYGVRWRRSAICSFPDHVGKCKPDRSISPLLSWHLLSNKGCLVSVGSGICRPCRGRIQISDADQQEWANPESISVTKLQSHAVDTDFPFESYDQAKRRKNEDEAYDTTFSNFSSQTDSIPSSQVSSWSDNVEPSLDDVNEAIGILSNGQISPLKFQVKREIDTFQPSTKRLIKRKALMSVESLLNGIAPGQSQDLMKIIFAPEPERNADSTLKQIIVKSYEESGDRNTKRQLLSLIVDSNTKKELMQMIPNLTMYAIDEARKHARKEGHGIQIPSQPLHFRQRMDSVKLDHALDFIFNPTFHQVSSFGTKEMKLDDGTVVTIPEVVRTACHSTLINIYQKYCKDTDFIPLSRSSLFKILGVCASSKRTNLKGLDNVAADGGESFETLLKILLEMEKYITDENLHITLRELKDNLTNNRIYLKTDYKLHLSLSDRCADHCISYALSDSLERGYVKACDDHEHDQICERCDLLPQSLSEMKELVGTLDLPEDISEEFLASIEVAEGKIQNWKSHIMRSANQDLARSLLLSRMDYGEALIIMDWAMKFLPIAYREKQSDWYGQKGVNWHVCVCIYKDEDGILKQRTYAHIMDSAKQDWLAVATLLEHMLSIIKTQIPGIKEVNLRSDNAGCYHCGNLWLAIPEISQRTGINIARYDFSEAQNGKSYCDSKIAHMRSQIRKVAASGNDILNAADMKMAIDQNGGITACQSAHVDILSSTSSSGARKIKQISKISNVQFNSEGSITVWRAYEIGCGVKVSLQYQEGHFENQFEVHQNFTLPDIPDGHITVPTYRCEMDENFSISCPENSCICTFDSYIQMQNHCLIGNHEFSSSSSTFDSIKLRWKDTCFNMSTEVHKMEFESGMKSGTSISEMGWALKKEKKNVRFSEKVKDYLCGIFEAGEVSGRKANPSTVVQNMRVARNEDGSKMFKPHEYLELGQISSYFSRLACLKCC